MKLSTNLAILLISTSLAFTGCKKKDNAAAPPPESTATTKPADPAMAKPADPGAAAAAPAAPGGGGTIASDEDYVKGVTAMMDKMIGVFKAAGTNCDKLADDITKMSADNDATIKAIDSYEKAHPDVKKKLEAAGKDQMKAFEEAAGPAMTSCKDSKKLQDAMSKFSPG